MPSVNENDRIRNRESRIQDSRLQTRQKKLRRDRLKWEIEQKREELQRQEKEAHAVHEEINKRRQELEDEINEQLGLQKLLIKGYHPLPSQQNKPTESKQLQQENKTSQKSTLELRINTKGTALTILTACIQLKHRYRKLRNYTVLSIILTPITSPKTVKCMGN